MQPIQELLSRIRWDRHFGRARFSIGYYDRVRDEILVVSFRQLHFPRDEHFVFELVDAEGQLHSIPFHRVRQVYRNGRLIWNRPPKREESGGESRVL